jgi:hypothetical protein
MENQNTLALSSESNEDLFTNLAAQMEAIEKFGMHIAKSGMCGCDKVEQGTIIAFTCIAERITPMQFSRTYDLIQGKPTKKAASMLAELRQRGGDFEWVDTGDDGKKATLKIWYNGRELTPVTYKIEDATHLLKGDNWKNNPGEMLRARATTKALRMHVPEIAAGVYDPLEIPDLSFMNTPAAPIPAEGEHKDRLMGNLDELDPGLRKRAQDKITKRFKVAEIESLNDGQCLTVLDAWQVFIEQLADGSDK